MLGLTLLFLVDFFSFKSSSIIFITGLFFIHISCDVHVNTLVHLITISSRVQYCKVWAVFIFFSAQVRHLGHELN